MSFNFSDILQQNESFGIGFLVDVYVAYISWNIYEPISKRQASKQADRRGARRALSYVTEALEWQFRISWIPWPRVLLLLLLLCGVCRHTRSLCAVKLRFSAAQGGKEIPVGSRRTWPGYCGEVSTVKQQQQQLNDCTRHTQVKRTIRELWTLLS